MTIKELKDTIGQYPDDAQIYARVIARNGRGGTFEEQLLLNDTHHDKDDNAVYMNFGFEIGWLNAHPEFQPPAEPEAKTDDEAREEIFEDLGTALGREVKPEQALSGLTPDEVKAVLGACDHLVGNGNKSPDNTASCTPGTRERLLSLGTFGNLVDYMLGYCGCEPETRVLASCSCGDAPELRTGVDGKYAYVCPNCGRAGAITDTQEQAAVLWNQAFGPDQAVQAASTPEAKFRSEILEIIRAVFDERASEIRFDTKIEDLCDAKPEGLEDLFAECRKLKEEGATSYCPNSLEEAIACKTFGGLVDYLIDGKEASY